MTNFQTIGLTVSALLFVATVLAAAGHVMSRRAAAAWTLLWVAAATAIARPSLTVTIAHFLGIGRGADLVFYCGMLAMLFGFWLNYLRAKRMEREITRLVRAIAIRDAERDGTVLPETTR